MPQEPRTFFHLKQPSMLIHILAMMPSKPPLRASEIIGSLSLVAICIKVLPDFRLAVDAKISQVDTFCY